MNDEQIAAAFFGDSKPANVANTAQPAVSDDAKVAAAFYGTDEKGAQQPGAPSAATTVAKSGAEPTALDLVRADPMRKMFDPELSNGTIFDELTATSGLDGVDHDLAPVEGVDRAEFSAIVADHGATHADVREFLSDYREFAAAKLTEPDKQAFLADAVQGMKEQFGDGWEGAWDAAAALAKRDPRVAKMLRESGLGADRKTVIRFAEEALRQRADGRLK